MRVFATGVTGRIGPALAAALAGRHDVIALGRRDWPGAPFEYRRGDVNKLGDLLQAAQGADVIVHMGGRSSADAGDDDVVFTTNVGGTFNVLEAARRLGIPKLVYTSSTRAFGLGFRQPFTPPDYVPTDEAHPSRPKDTYGISKLMAEETCRLASAQWGLTVICLRLPWVLTEHDVATMAEHVRRPEARPFGLWCWVDQRDAAQAVRLAVEDERLAGYQQFIITADDTGTAADSAALLAEFYPSVTDIRAEMAGRRSLVSSARAKRELGFRPAYTLADGPLADVLTAARRGPESGGRSAL